MNVIKQHNRFVRLHLNKLLAVLIACVGWVACTATVNASKNLSAASILEKIRKQEPVLIENMTIEGDLDFTSLETYPELETVRRATIESPVFFKNCVFTGKVLGFSQRNGQTILSDFRKNLTFLSCKFNGEVSFQSASVQGIASFSNSQFNRPVSFIGTRFGLEAYFDHLLFASEVQFQSATFGKLASFWKTVWGGAVNFQGAVFNADAQFNLSDFRSNLDFSLCTTNGLLNFNYVQLPGRSIFDNCRFRNAVDFGNATLGEVTLKEAMFESKVSFADTKSKSISLEDAFFLTQKPALTFAAPQPQIDLKGTRMAASETVIVE
jgi:hypothetical protein